MIYLDWNHNCNAFHGEVKTSFGSEDRWDGTEPTVDFFVCQSVGEWFEVNYTSLSQMSAGFCFSNLLQSALGSAMCIVLVALEIFIPRFSYERLG